MTAKQIASDGYAFGAEGMAGTAGASALRRVRDLAARAPSGRMFAAIATLTELSRRAERSLEAGAQALASGSDHQASLSLSRAILQMDQLAATGSRTDHVPEELPDFLRRMK